MRRGVLWQRKKEIVNATAEIDVGATALKDAGSVKAEAKKTKAAKSEKAEPAFTTIVQVDDKEFDITDIAAKAYKAYKSVHKRKTVNDFVVYVKPEENAVYYSVNGEGSEEYKIDL